jgi:hypothetical protein
VTAVLVAEAELAWSAAPDATWPMVWAICWFAAAAWPAAVLCWPELRGTA